MNKSFCKAKEIQQYIDEHFREELNLSELAVKFGITKYYLCHIFKKHIGYSVIQYVNIQKLLFFRRHYVPGVNMDILATQAGFKSYCLFYKVFRKEYGMAPGKGVELFKEYENKKEKAKT